MATEKRPVGRPCKYRPEYAQQLIDYFNRPAWDVVVPGKDGEEDKIVEGFFPTLAGFCCEIMTTQMTLRTWATAKDLDGTPLWPEFFAAYAYAKEKQEQVFSQGYLRGKYSNPAIGTLIAKNLMNWRDKQEVESNVTSTSTVRHSLTVKQDLDFSDLIDD